MAREISHDRANSCVPTTCQRRENDQEGVNHLRRAGQPQLARYDGMRSPRGRGVVNRSSDRVDRELAKARALRWHSVVARNLNGGYNDRRGKNTAL